MKNRILTFIIGILTGAIIIVLGFKFINYFNDDYYRHNYPYHQNENWHNFDIKR